VTVPQPQALSIAGQCSRTMPPVLAPGSLAFLLSRSQSSASDSGDTSSGEAPSSPVLPRGAPQARLPGGTSCGGHAASGRF